MALGRSALWDLPAFISLEGKRKIRRRVFTSSITRHCLTVTAYKCTKNRDARTKLLFCYSKPIAFLTFSLPLPLSLLRLLMVAIRAIYFRRL